MRIPCIKNSGLKIFTTTADERLTLGEDIFLNTHFTSRFRRYRGENLIEEWDENHLLDFLIEKDDKIIGNRTFILFGAAGSGKSETVRWLEILLNTQNNAKSLLRISRTELDPVKILQKLLILAGKELNVDTLIKWEILKNKPVSLANSIVWNSLSMILDKDEDIIPISYKLRPLIENNLKNSFSNLTKSQILQEKIVELITVEELEDVIGSCALKINIDYEQLRKHLVERLETEVLGGYGFVNTLREVGRSIYTETGRRPVLLIDDLVQSMNIYASELLDFFITFEEGNWDIVIGLTPASFETTKRGRELLTRINYLDTFDDRLYKLWLTDEFGNESYTINSENVNEYINNYLSQFKKNNGFVCNKQCSHYAKCISLQWGEESNVCLTPLNKYLISRIFTNLFKTKGQARQFVITVREYLQSIIEMRELEFFSNRIIRENCVDIEDISKKIYVESFMPLNVIDKMEIPKEFLKICGFKKSNNLLIDVIKIENSLTVYNTGQSISIESENLETNALKDWLEGKEINKELLRNFRVMCNSFLREVTQKTDLGRFYTSRNNSCIRKEKTIEGCKLPIKIEDVDKFEGIEVNKSIGYQAFECMQIKDVNEKTQANLINHLMSNNNIREMINQTSNFKKHNLNIFEQLIDISCYELAFLLYVFAFNIYDMKKSPMLINKVYKRLCLTDLKEIWSGEVFEIEVGELRFIEDFFCDWFELRENLYDGYRLSQYIEQYSDIKGVLKKLMEIKVDGLSDDYMIGNDKLKMILGNILSKSKIYYDIITDNKFEIYCKYIISIMNELKKSDMNIFVEFQAKLENIKNDYLNFRKMITIPKLFKEKDFINFLNKTNEVQNSYPESIGWVNQIIKSPVFKWYSQVEDISNQLIGDYTYVHDNFISKFNNSTIKKSLPDLNYTEIELNIEQNVSYSISEIINSLNENLIKLKNIYKKLSIISEIEGYVEFDLINRIMKFNEFTFEMGKFLNRNELEQLQISYYYEFTNKLIVNLVNLYNPNLTEVNVDRVNTEIIKFSNIDIDKIKKETYKTIIRKVKFNKEFFQLNGNNLNKVNIRKISILLNRALGNEDVFKELKSQLNILLKTNLSSESLFKLLNSKEISEKNSHLIVELYEKGFCTNKLSSINMEMLDEINTSLPNLMDNIQCVFSID
jgi:hypothetical protein